MALRLAGAGPDEPHMERAAAWVRAHGGLPASRVFTRIWLALVGRWDWEDLPVIPPEIMFLPKQAPLNIYDFACWARQTVVALTVVMSYRPARPLGFDLDELMPAGRTSGQRADGRRYGPGPGSSNCWTGPCTPMNGCPNGSGPGGRCGGRPWPEPSDGSSIARKPTACGGVFSRRSCTPSSPSTSSAIRWTTPL